MPLTMSDSIQLLVMFLTTFTSVTSIIIAIKTLQQNNKMIEDSTRPVIHIYSKYVDSVFYIVIKNLGQSVAYIDEIQTDFYISPEENNMVSGNPFENLAGSSLPPQTSKICPLVSYSLTKRQFKFHIKYHSTTHKYEEEIQVNGDADNVFPNNYSSIIVDNQPEHIVSALKVIAHALQDLVKDKL